jgi:hypothetical protein
MKAKNLRINLPVIVKPNSGQRLAHYVGRHALICSFGVLPDTCYIQLEQNGTPVIAKAFELRKLKDEIAIAVLAAKMGKAKQ